MSRMLHLLSGPQRQRIAGTAFRILARVGVRLTEPAARALLAGAGARLAGDRAYFPSALIERALSSAPRSLAIYNREGALAMRLEPETACFGAHTDAPDVLDPFSGLRRPCLVEDVQRNVRLIDALERISFTTASGLIADCPPELADRVALAQCLVGSRKPVLAMPVSLQALVDCREMAAVAAGGAAALRGKPSLIVYAEPVSPLSHPDESIRKLLYCAAQTIPIAYVPYAAQGGTAPLSQAAIIAQLCAESLSALVIHQLGQPGAPFIFGGMASVMDMRTTIFSYGAPEFQLGNSLMAEMAQHFGMPNFGTAGTSDAQCFDGQAILEAASSCLMALLSGAQLVHDVGLLGNATVVIPEMIVATDEIIAMLQHLLRPVPVDDAALSLGLFAEVGRTGDFIMQPHTLAHLRDVWYPALLYRRGARAWAAGTAETFEQRVNARTREILTKHTPPPLPPDRVAGIDLILERAAAAHAQGTGE